MKVVFIGPGAIGCLFAARFARAKIKTVLFDKSPKRAEILKHKGITTTNISGKQYRIFVQVETCPENIIDADFICLCVKSYDTATTVRKLECYLRNKTIVSFQNGMGNMETIIKHIPSAYPVYVSTAQGAIIEKTGLLKHTGNGDSYVSPFTEKAYPRARLFARILRLAGFKTHFQQDVVKTLWTKLIINSAINPVTALWKIRNGEILKHKKAYQTAYEATMEAIQVAKKCGINLSSKKIWEMVLTTCRKTQHNKSSMLMDLTKHRRTEIDYINGYLCKKARQLHVNVPVNNYLYRTIHTLETKQLSKSCAKS